VAEPGPLRLGQRLTEGEPLCEGEAAGLRDAAAEELAVKLLLAQGDALADPDGEPVAELVREAAEVRLAVPVAEEEPELVAVREALPENEAVPEAVRVAFEVPVLLADPVPEDVAEAVGEAVAEHSAGAAASACTEIAALLLAVKTVDVIGEVPLKGQSLSQMPRRGTGEPLQERG
jgi:hypothetical protein